MREVLANPLRQPGTSATRPAAPTRALICGIAAIGFAFDSYELLLLPLVVRPALAELGGLRPGTPEFTAWFGLLFYVPALAGGVFGLLGGYLTDRLGRRRLLTWSILVYAGAAFASGLATSLTMLLVCRCLVFVGVCVEFVAAIAWLAETFPHPRSRERVLAVTQAFSSVGGLLVGLAGAFVASAAAAFPPISLPAWASALGTIGHPHAEWRYLLMSGLVPAVPLILVRPLLPESPAWQQRRAAGTLQRPSPADLFAPGLRRTTAVTTVMVTCSFAAAFGAIQQMPQIVPGLPDVKAEIASALETRLPADHQARLRASLIARGRTEADAAAMVAAERRRLASSIELARSASATTAQEIGGLVGRVALAVVVLLVASRRRQIRLFLVPGLLVMPLTFAWAGVTSLDALRYGMFAAGVLTVAQFSFWGNYLPLAFPLHLRGTGESFAVNVGGRMMGTACAALTQWIAYWLPGPSAAPARVAFAAAAVATAAYAFNLLASTRLPEPAERAPSPRE